MLLAVAALANRYRLAVSLAIGSLYRSLCVR